jgi:flagellar biosynthetic protein FlhB
LPLVLFVVALSMLAILLQIGFVFSAHSLKPDFTRLNPATGFKRIFSIQTLYETGKSVLKLAVYCALAYLVIFAAARYATQSAGEPRAVAALIGDNAVRLLFWLLGAMAVFAAVDLLFVRRQYSKKMMMSRREIREEMRQREGDSRIKQRRRQLAQELLKRARSMRQLRGADVLVTNPTHFAVALRYEPQRMVSPQVVSKGSGEFALRLRRLAFIYGVPTIESRSLARGLFFRVALDQSVPEKYFRDTAAVYLRMRTARQARDASSAGEPSMQLV